MTQPSQKQVRRENHLFVVAIRKSGVQGWQWCRSEVVGKDDFIVTGGVPRTITRGPNKGKTTWDKKSLTSVVVTRAEIQTEEARYEREEGKCHACYGDGEVPWSVGPDGKKTSPCKRCGGTGKPPTG